MKAFIIGFGWLTVVCVLLLCAGLARAAAQEAPAPPAKAAQPKADPAPQVPNEVKQAIATLGDRVRGLSDAQRVLQKELDSVVADLQRLAQQAQQACGAGFELSPQLTCTKKPEAKAPEPKKDKS